MTNYDIAVSYGVELANVTKQGGQVVLGLIGSGLNTNEVNNVFLDIKKQTAVILLEVKAGVYLRMKKV
jgi:hypothetical protein